MDRVKKEKSLKKPMEIDCAAVKEQKYQLERKHKLSKLNKAFGEFRFLKIQTIQSQGYYILEAPRPSSTKLRLLTLSM